MHANQVFTRAMSKLGNRKPSAALESLLFSRHKSLCLTWVTEWKGRPGSGTRQLEVALSQRRGSAAFMPARCSFSPHKCTLLAMSAGPWAVTAYSFGCCLSIHVSHNSSLIIRVTKAWKSKTLQRVLELRLEDSLWTWNFLLPPLLGVKQKAKLNLLGHHLSALCQARMFSSCLGSNVAKLLGEGRGKRSRQGKSSPWLHTRHAWRPRRKFWCSLPFLSLF